MKRLALTLFSMWLATTATAQTKEWNSDALLRAQILRRHPASIDPNVATVRVLTREHLAGGNRTNLQDSPVHFGGVASAEMTVADYLQLRSKVHSSSLMLDEGYDPSEASPADLAHAVELHRGLFNETPLLGRNVLLAVYDSGIDWKHESFKRGDSSTAIALIWDLTEMPSASFAPPLGQSRGRLYDRATLLEAQRGLRSDVSTADRTGHGTAVASVALAVAPGAHLVIIKGGNERFSESGLIEALAFLDSLGTAWNMPVVLNLSFGSQRGPHDGTQLTERAIDAFVSRQGRFVVAAAGNDGGKGIHAEGQARRDGDSTVATIHVRPYEPNAGMSNDGIDLEIWLSDTNKASITLETPSGRRVTSDRQGTSFDVGNEGVIVIDRPAAGRVVTVQLSDAAGVAPSPGSYRLIVRSGGSFHAWITNSRFGPQTVRFAPDGEVVTERHTIHSPATASGALAVGATEFTSGAFQAAAWSSVGPRVDGRVKPELNAPGVCWVGSMGRSMSGTSISAPMVAGVAALLFESRPHASLSEVWSALTNGTSTDLHQVDAAASLSSLTGQESFAASFLALKWEAPTQLTWTAQRLSGAVRFDLVDRATSVRLAQWTAMSGSIRQQVELSGELCGQVRSGRVTLEAVDEFERSLPFEIPGEAGATTTAERAEAAPSLQVGAYPNPFNASTLIKLDVPAAGALTLAIYSIDGREVTRLHDGAVDAGTVVVPWSSTVASGTYFLRSVLSAVTGKVEVKALRLVVLR